MGSKKRIGSASFLNVKKYIQFGTRWKRLNPFINSFLCTLNRYVQPYLVPANLELTSFD